MEHSMTVYLLMTIQLLTGQNALPKESPLPTIAYLVDSKVYTPESGDTILLRINCRKRGNQPRVEVFLIPGGVTDESPLQLHMVDGLVWSGVTGGGYASRIPLDDLRFFDAQTLADDKKHERLSQEFNKKYSGKVTLRHGGGYKLGWDLNLLNAIRRQETKRKLECKPQLYHSYSLLPNGPTTLRVFVLQNDKEIKVWDCRGKWQPDKGEWQVNCQRRPQEDFRAAFLEPFYVFAQEDDNYFLTQSGKLYIARAPEKGKRRQMEALWQDKSKPLTTFISDNDHKKAYCFGKSKDGKEEFFFELAPKVQPQPVPRKEIQPVQVEQPRLRTVLEYVQVLPSQREKNKEQ
jgi:hypothetical protein